MRFSLTGISLIFSSSLLMGAAPLSNIVINQSSEVARYICGADASVVINGSNNQMVFSGDCDSVVVNGANNSLVFEGLNRLTVNGSSNSLTWSYSDNGEPSAVLLGRDNELRNGDYTSTFKTVGELTEGETVDASSQVVSIGAASEKNIECDNDDVSIVGAGMSVTLTGRCNVVTVVGSNNSISAEDVGLFNLIGTGNQVSHSAESSPEVIAVGLGNSVSPQ
ncbi:MAG: DUF3060 domain-containing protein [Cyanobacteria bacterium P01_E01_bin.45]